MEENRPGGVTVLFVEDERDIRDVVAGLLKASGYNCIVAENGREGLELFRRHTPDIVLSDIMMPLMSGLEMARAIRVDYPEAQFIFMTAFGDCKFIFEAIEIGVSQYIVKPVELPKLLAAISHCKATTRLKNEARRVQQLEAIGVLAGGLAHDYNNLLQMVLGYVSLAKLTIEPGSTAYAHLSLAESITGDARELSQRLQIFSSGGSGPRQRMSLSPLLTTGVRAALGETAVTPVFDLPPDIPLLMLDKPQIQQVISHLTDNAVEAMPQGGVLEVGARIIRLSRDSGLLLPSGEYVQISFSDTGIGIPPENLPRIFDPYFTTRQMDSHKGRGLGLSVCHSIIRQHGGLISASNATPAGAVITIWLPVADP